tara:strand:- start:9200 stop:9607 length:408 start_codon:yes stop_codon:yes gene_type:complete
MLSNQKFKIQLDSKVVSVYGEEKYITDKLTNDQVKRKLTAEDIAGVNLLLNIEYLVEFETREYGIKSVILSASSIFAFGNVDYYTNKEGDLDDFDIELDLSDFDVIFEKSDSTYDSIYPKDAMLYFNEKKIEIQY